MKRQGCRFSVFSVIFGPICSLFSPVSSFSFCLFLCAFSVRRHTHIDFQLFSQKSSGIPERKRVARDFSAEGVIRLMEDEEFSTWCETG